MCIFTSADEDSLPVCMKTDIPVKVLPCSKTILAARASAFWRIWFCNLAEHDDERGNKTERKDNGLNSKTLTGQDALSAPSFVGLRSRIDGLLKLGGGGLGDARE